MSITAANVNNFVKQYEGEWVSTTVDIPAIILRCEAMVVSFDDRITSDDKDNLVLLLAAFFVCKEVKRQDYKEFYEMYTDLKKDIKNRLDAESVIVDTEGVDSGGVVTIGKLSKVQDTNYVTTRTQTKRRY